MLADKGIKINRITVVAFFLDWVENQKLRNRDYQEEPIMEYEIDVWSDQSAFEFITERMELHYDCRDDADEDLPRCDAEEMWENPPKYALMKDGNAKRAMKVLHEATTIQEAVQMACELPKVSKDSYIEIRHQARKRCDKFCAVNEWCNQYQEYKKSGGGERIERFELGGVL
jgi:hypothetical protein